MGGGFQSPRELKMTFLPVITYGDIYRESLKSCFFVWEEVDNLE